MAQTNYLRQMNILPPKLFKDPYVLIGAGGIGSPIAFTLAKMGVTDLTIWDDDKIESHNLPNQFYKLRQLGEGKAVSLAANIKEFADLTVHPVERRYKNSALRGIVISAVDSIDERKVIWQGVLKNPRVLLYIETRMAAELFQIYPVPMQDKERIDWYHDQLYKPVKPFVARCTAAAIFYTVMQLAGVVGEVVKSYLVGDALPKQITVDLKTYKMLTVW